MAHETFCSENTYHLMIIAPNVTISKLTAIVIQIIMATDKPENIGLVAVDDENEHLFIIEMAYSGSFYSWYWGRKLLISSWSDQNKNLPWERNGNRVLLISVGLTGSEIIYQNLINSLLPKMTTSISK